MKRWCSLALLLSAMAGQPALASFDMDEDGCDFWYPSCELDAYPFLSADNDTRANLVMLMADLKGLSAPFPDSSTRATERRDNPFALINPAADSAETGAVIPLHALISEWGLQLSPETATPVIREDDRAEREFIQALLADTTLSPPQRRQLAYQRLMLAGYPLEKIEEATFPAGSHAQALADYLSAAGVFYAQQFDEAQQRFSALTTSPQPWVAEAAHYMLFRVALNKLTANALDEYGFFGPGYGDKATAAAAIEAGDRYQAAYPDGRWLHSLKGLYRRVYWTTGDLPQLAETAEAALHQAGDMPELVALSNELDQRLLSQYFYYRKDKPLFLSDDESPILTFIQSLRRLRTHEDGTPRQHPLTQEELSLIPARLTEQQHADFSHYLVLMSRYQQQDYAGVEAAIPAAGEIPLTSTLAFSHQALRGLAMHQQQKWPQAEAHWRHLLTRRITPIQQRFVQLMLANALAFQEQPGKIFAPDSPVTNLRIRALVLKRLADAPVLRRQAVSGLTEKERIIAVHTLLTRDLLNGHYQDYLQDRALLAGLTEGKPDAGQTETEAETDTDLSLFNWDGSDVEEGYFCAGLTATAEALAKNRHDGHALNCMGEFFRLTDLRVNDTPEWRMQWQLTQAPATFAGTPHDVLDFYWQVIEMPDLEPEDKSYALYRAVHCFAPSSYNHCGSDEVPQETRKAWFQALKRGYKGSRWDQQTEYYW